jgi:hypothetical protein
VRGVRKGPERTREGKTESIQLRREGVKKCDIKYNNAYILEGTVKKETYED